MADNFRLRVCFGKTGRLAHLSHLETMRACERAARRGGMPYAVTQGFTPRMRMAFGPALPVGTAGEREYYDLWLTRYLESSVALDSLMSASPSQLAPRACGYVSEREPSLAAALTIAVYEVGLEGPARMTAPVVAEALRRVTGEGSLRVERQGKSKVFDLTESLPKEPKVTSSEGRVTVLVTIRVGEHGSLRPELLVTKALTSSSLDGMVATVVRTDQFIEEVNGAVRRPL